MERQIPRGIPRILPLVGHGDDVGVVEVRPFAVAAVFAFGGRRRLVRVAVNPFRHVVVEELFRPNHPGERLTLDVARVGVGDVLLQLGVELVGLAAALGEDGVEVGEGVPIKVGRDSVEP